MEHQAAQHQQYVSIEGIDNSNVVVVKGINVLLTLLQVPITLYQYQYHIFSSLPGCVNTSCHCRSDSETFSADTHPCRNHGKHQKYFIKYSNNVVEGSSYNSICSCHPTVE